MNSAFRNGLDDCDGLAGIVDLTTDQPQADRASVSIVKGVEFAGDAAPGTRNGAL
jgi:hypothetical protein